jgi:16S rRNA (adenine1518-N6/adenine1519-N6)-dimethyltransferase
MLTQSQLKETFAKHRFKPLKRFGENYLVDSNVKDRIIDEIAPSAGDTILEIGPGMGALTIDLARSGAMVVAVEKDPKAFAILEGIVAGVFPNLKLVHGDILEFDIKAASSGRKLKVVGNLPYYITTPIIEAVIADSASIGSAYIMVQKEVAARLLASPGSKDYGSLSCFVQYHTRPSYLFTVKRTSFYPSPGVDSSFISLETLSKPSVDVADEGLFFRVVRGAFNQRRKTIINSLSREAVLGIPKDELAALLRGAGIDPAIRPERLSLADFARIASAALSGTRPFGDGP